MSSLRAIRSVSNVLRSVAPSTARTFAYRPIATVVSRASVVVPAINAQRSFSLTARRLANGESDLELASKLQEEIQYEKEAADNGPKIPEFVSEFQSDGVWKIDSTPGNDEVTLHRTFGNEEIRVVFSIADIDTEQHQESLDEDGNPVETPEEDEANVFPIRCNITITKPKSGALSVDAVADDGNFNIESVSYYKNAKLAVEQTTEADWARRGLYIGPQFDHLDVGVQEAFEKFLEERGIGQSLASFVPEYAEYKEQQEYTKWLSGVYKFVSE